MIKVRKDNIFEMFDKTDGVIMIHGCNCQGKYASGFAKQVRELYPKAYEDYMKYYRNATSTILGQTCVSEVAPGKIIHNAFTQVYYGRNKNTVYVSYPAIREVFAFASKEAQRLGVPLIFPDIGAGLAGGNSETIHSIMKGEIGQFVDAYLFFKP